MKRILFVFVICYAFANTLWAQEDTRFTASVTMDSILYGNKFKVTFTLENGQGQAFQAPVFPDFHVMSGPNTSSSFSMMNGTVSQSISYTYWLEPKDIGNYYIEPASIEVEGDILETQPIEVMVVPNPDGIIQKEENNSMSPFGNFEFRMDNLFPQDFFAPQMPAPKQRITPEEEGATPKPKTKKKKKRKTYKL